MRYAWNSPSTPVYAPNSHGGPHANPARATESAWSSEPAVLRAEQVLHPEDDDVAQARIPVNEAVAADLGSLVEQRTGTVGLQLSRAGRRAVNSRRTSRRR